MALNVVQIAREISALAVDGVHIADLSQIPDNALVRDLPLIYPKPDGYISDLNVRIDSFGSAQAKKTVFYTLNYRYLHSPVGAGRGLFDVYEDLVAKAALFLDAIIANDALAGQIDLQAVEIPNFSAGVADPSGNQFHGADLALTVMEFVN